MNINLIRKDRPMIMGARYSYINHGTITVTATLIYADIVEGKFILQLTDSHYQWIVNYDFFCSDWGLIP